MREIILEERRQRLERFITKVNTKEPLPHLRLRWVGELLDLLFGYLRTKNEAWPRSSTTMPERIEGTAGPFLQMYVHDPVISRTKDAIRILDKGDLKGLRAFLERLASAEEGELIGSEIQTIYARRKHKGGPFEDLLIEIFKQNPAISGKDFEREVRKHVGGPIIRSMNDQLNEIILKDGRDFKISGLEDRLSKLRTKY
jgi:hypothetical protein